LINPGEQKQAEINDDL